VPADGAAGAFADDPPITVAVAVRSDARPARTAGGAGTETPLPAGRATVELHCASCGYGVVVRVAPDTCPMCRGTVWVPRRSRSGDLTYD